MAAPKTAKRGCGVVIKGVDRDRWVKSRKALPRRVCTATAADVMGVCVLTEILDLVFNMRLNIHNVHRCIDTFLKNQ